MSKPITKRQHDAATHSIRSDIKDLGRHFNRALGLQTRKVEKRFDVVEERLDKIENALEQILEEQMFVTRRELLNLLAALKASGVAIDQAKILSR